ncbi:MAG: SsrA-binding protein SmpB [Patescibacteria group bacterium]
MKPVINKQAKFDYDILEKFEAGLVLTGPEVKSIKAGQINLKGSIVTIKHTPQTEVYLTNAHISKYKPAGSQPSYDPTASRKLLLHKKEISKLIGLLKQKGLTLIPLRVYTKHNRIKLEFCVAKGKKKYEKKKTIKEREAKRQIERAMKQY